MATTRAIRKDEVDLWETNMKQYVEENKILPYVLVSFASSYHSNAYPGISSLTIFRPGSDTASEAMISNSNSDIGVLFGTDSFTKSGDAIALGRYNEFPDTNVLPIAFNSNHIGDTIAFEYGTEAVLGPGTTSGNGYKLPMNGFSGPALYVKKSSTIYDFYPHIQTVVVEYDRIIVHSEADIYFAAGTSTIDKDGYSNAIEYKVSNYESYDYRYRLTSSTTVYAGSYAKTINLAKEDNKVWKHYVSPTEKGMKTLIFYLNDSWYSSSAMTRTLAWGLVFDQSYLGKYGFQCLRGIVMSGGWRE